MDLTLLGVLLISFFATLISSMSGGGSSIIALPLFLAMGFPFLLSTAIQKVSAVFWVLPASKNYLRGRRVDWRFLIGFAIIGLVGVVLGIVFLLSITEKTAEVLIGCIIVIVVVWIYFDKKFGLQRTKTSGWKRKLSYVLALPIGFYEAIFGSGNGIILSLVGVKLRGFDISESLGYYFAVAFGWVLLAAILLIAKGFYDMPVMIAGVVGATAGGYLGSKFARFKGNSFVKAVFCAVGIILGFKLILGW